MAILSKYSLEKYNSLLLPEIANNELKNKNAEFDELIKNITPIIKKNKIELGLRLLHGHNIPLKGEQAMVEKFDYFQEEPALITSADSPNASYPASWILSDDQYWVFEYSSDPYVKKVYERLEDSSVLDEISAQIRKYKLDSLIGPCITARETLNKFDMSEGKSFVEHTIKIEDKFVNIVRSRPNDESATNGIKTIWGVKINDSCITNIPCFCCINDNDNKRRHFV
ncbi:7455_t:CDS:1 [Cetraspora pellucida]|uniref:7455_t:CDS:1 n=1 Tax=Cetraspora pellucida TaxID=1433469 RepID=A0A9N9AFL9_9GLOM|nr:7455_t:CDS:1 [Cetraspora pellucida]